MNTDARSSLPGEGRLDQLLTHAAWVRGLAAQLVKGPHDADDIVQDVWQATLAAGRGDAVRSPRGWLAGAVRNVANLRRRADGRRQRREQRVPVAVTAPSTAELVADQELRRQLIEHVDVLPEGEREVVLLRFWQDLPPRAVAKRLGIPVNTVRSRTARALQRLRTQLDERHGDRRAWCLMLVPLLDEGLLRAAGAAPAAVSAKAALLATAALAVLGFGGVVVYDNLTRYAPPDLSRDTPASDALARFAVRPVESAAQSAAQPASIRQDAGRPAAGPLSVRGQVVDLDGNPIADAVVHREKEGWLRAKVRDGDITAAEWTAASDAQGRFEFGPRAFRVWRPTRTLTIGEVTHRNYVAEAGYTEWPLTAEPRLVMRATVDAELDIEVVEKGTGIPVPRFGVSLHAWWGRNIAERTIVAGDPNRRYFGSLRDEDGIDGRLRRGIRLVTGTVNHLHVEVCGCQTIKERLVVPTAPGAIIRRRYEVEFDASARVPGNRVTRGRVVDEATGAAVPGAYVSVEIEDETGIYDHVYSGHTTSRADGSFALGLAPEKRPIELVVTQRDYLPEHAPFSAVDDVEVRLARYSSLALTVVSGGVPVPGAHVLLRHDGTLGTDGHARGVTDALGVVRFDRLPPVTVGVYVVPGASSPDEQALDSMRFAVERGVQHEATFEMQRVESVTVHGTVMTERGVEPVLVPTFIPLDSDRGWVQARPRGLSGYFAGGMRRGRYLVFLAPADDGHRDGPFAFVPPVEVKAPLGEVFDLELPRGRVVGQLFGIEPTDDLRVVAVPHVPARSLAVDQLLGSPKFTELMGAVVDERGVFELRRVADGGWDLELRRGAEVLARRAVDVAGGLSDVGAWQVGG